MTFFSTNTTLTPQEPRPQTRGHHLRGSPGVPGTESTRRGIRVPFAQHIRREGRWRTLTARANGPRPGCTARRFPGTGDPGQTSPTGVKHVKARWVIFLLACLKGWLSGTWNFCRVGPTPDYLYPVTCPLRDLHPRLNPERLSWRLVDVSDVWFCVHNNTNPTYAVGPPIRDRAAQRERTRLLKARVPCPCWGKCGPQDDERVEGPDARVHTGAGAVPRPVRRRTGGTPWCGCQRVQPTARTFKLPGPADFTPMARTHHPKHPWQTHTLHTTGTTRGGCSVGTTCVEKPPRTHPFLCNKQGELRFVPRLQIKGSPKWKNRW